MKKKQAPANPVVRTMGAITPAAQQTLDTFTGKLGLPRFEVFNIALELLASADPKQVQEKVQAAYSRRLSSVFYSASEDSDAQPDGLQTD